MNGLKRYELFGINFNPNIINVVNGELVDNKSPCPKNKKFIKSLKIIIKEVLFNVKNKFKTRNWKKHQ